MTKSSVLENDHIYGHIRTIEELPGAIVERLKHYFSTYKMIKDLKPGIKIIDTFGASKAKEIVNAAIEDYRLTFGGE